MLFDDKCIKVHKQKELFKKRLEGLPLKKTEQEYYSRSVKKKVVALANAELHGFEDIVGETIAKTSKTTVMGSPAP